MKSLTFFLAAAFLALVAADVEIYTNSCSPGDRSSFLDPNARKGKKGEKGLMRTVAGTCYTPPSGITCAKGCSNSHPLRIYNDTGCTGPWHRTVAEHEFARHMYGDSVTGDDIGSFICLEDPDSGKASLTDGL